MFNSMDYGANTKVAHTVLQSYIKNFSENVVHKDDPNSFFTSSLPDSGNRMQLLIQYCDEVETTIDTLENAPVDTAGKYIVISSQHEVLTMKNVLNQLEFINDNISRVLENIPLDSFAFTLQNQLKLRKRIVKVQDA